MSKQDLRDAYGEELWARYEGMKQQVKADLGAQGITSADLQGLEIEDTWEAGEVVRWEVVVSLKGGRRLVYQLGSGADAQLTRDGELVQLPARSN